MIAVTKFGCDSPHWNHSYSIAALRAGLIALALLAVLAVIVLS
jgi:hypothetical protein